MVPDNFSPTIYWRLIMSNNSVSLQQQALQHQQQALQHQEEAQQQALQHQVQGKAKYLAYDQQGNFLSTLDSSSYVSLGSGGGKQALDYLERNGPVTEGQVRNFKAATTKEVSDTIVHNQNVGNGTINGNPQYISSSKFDLLTLFNKILDNNFNQIAAQDGQAGLSATDLREFLSQ